MGVEPRDPVAELFRHERRRLVALAYRMLGTVSEAEDAVQESFVRWYRLDDSERAGIANPAGWLTRVTSRICLDMLGTARVRRERYVGQWLPEPVPANVFTGTTTYNSMPLVPSESRDPLDRVTLDESVSTALLVVLEAMTPAERVTFILHDVFVVPFQEIAGVLGRSPAAVRQLASFHISSEYGRTKSSPTVAHFTGSSKTPFANIWELSICRCSATARLP